LIYFDWIPASAKFHKRAVLHGKPNAMQHEPCGLLSDSKSAAHFVRTNAILAVRNHPNSDKPLIERECRILKDSSYFDRELFLGVLGFAFPQTASGDESHLFASASGAFHAIGPAALDHEGEAILWLGEINDGLLQTLGLFHGVPHSQKYGRNALLS